MQKERNNYTTLASYRTRLTYSARSKLSSVT